MSSPGVETDTPPVIEAIRADVSIVLLAFAASSASQSPFEEIPVFTIATDPGLDAYSVLFPLMTQLPPVRPSVYGVQAAAWQAP